MLSVLFTEFFCDVKMIVCPIHSDSGVWCDTQCQIRSEVCISVLTYRWHVRANLHLLRIKYTSGQEKQVENSLFNILSVAKKTDDMHELLQTHHFNMLALDDLTRECRLRNEMAMES